MVMVIQLISRKLEKRHYTLIIKRDVIMDIIRQVAFLVFVLTLLPVVSHGQALPEVDLVRVPDDGLQAVVKKDDKGVQHMIYFSGEPAGGDVYYVRSAPGDGSTPDAVLVNSQPGSVIAAGTVRGAHMDVDDEGRVHVAWMGSADAEPRGPEGAAPMLYSRSNMAGTEFEPQRNVMQKATGLDGGGTIAVGPAGEVYVVWHAGAHEMGEAHRRIWVARSNDGGSTFAEEVAVSPSETGTCGCCGMSAGVSSGGQLQIVYRGARDTIHRDMHLLTGNDDNTEFDHQMLEAWEIGACPMSTTTVYAGEELSLATWETEGQVAFMDITNKDDLQAIHAPGSGNNRKHPVIIRGEDGNLLFAWTEGTAWQRGGTVNWQFYDPKGNLLGRQGTAEGVPAWGKPAIRVDDEGEYSIIY